VPDQKRTFVRDIIDYEMAASDNFVPPCRLRAALPRVDDAPSLGPVVGQGFDL